jgi:ribosome modulation factor
MGSIDVPNDIALSKAYCEGRAAAYAGKSSSTNPHRTNTPEADAWFRGWSTYEAAGTVIVRDCCAQPMKLAVRTLTGVATDLSVTFTVSPTIACEIDPGDGTGRIDAPTGAAVHVYAAEGDYTAIAWLGGLKLDDVVVSPTEPAP